MLVALVIVALLCKRSNATDGELQKQLQDKTSELMSTIAGLSYSDEACDAMTHSDTSSEVEFDNLASDFSFTIFDKSVGQDMLRYIKIKCPGVLHEDVIIDVVGNSCIVTISRKSSHGVDAIEWVKKFEFSPSDGWFDLKDDQVTLAGGFLTLVFGVFKSR